MSLPKLPKKKPRPKAITVRVSKKTAEDLRKLAKKNNLSQADVIEYLIQAEVSRSEK